MGSPGDLFAVRRCCVPPLTCIRVFYDATFSVVFGYRLFDGGAGVRDHHAIFSPYADVTFYRVALERVANFEQHFWNDHRCISAQFSVSTFSPGGALHYPPPSPGLYPQRARYAGWPGVPAWCWNIDAGILAGVRSDCRVRWTLFVAHFVTTATVNGLRDMATIPN